MNKRKWKGRNKGEKSIAIFSSHRSQFLITEKYSLYLTEAHKGRDTFAAFWRAGGRGRENTKYYSPRTASSKCRPTPAGPGWLPAPPDPPKVWRTRRGPHCRSCRASGARTCSGRSPSPRDSLSRSLCTSLELFGNPGLSIKSLNRPARMIYLWIIEMFRVSASLYYYFFFFFSLRRHHSWWSVRPLRMLRYRVPADELVASLDLGRNAELATRDRFWERERKRKEIRDDIG